MLVNWLNCSNCFLEVTYCVRTKTLFTYLTKSTSYETDEHAEFKHIAKRRKRH